MELGIVITIAVGVIVAIFQDQLKSLGHRIADLARKTASGRHSDSPSVGPVSLPREPAPQRVVVAIVQRGREVILVRR